MERLSKDVFVLRPLVLVQLYEVQRKQVKFIYAKIYKTHVDINAIYKNTFL